MSDTPLQQASNPYDLSKGGPDATSRCLEVYEFFLHVGVHFVVQIAEYVALVKIFLAGEGQLVFGVFLVEQLDRLLVGCAVAEIFEILCGDMEIISGRPADRLEPELDKLRGEIAEWLEQPEDVLSYAQFPKVAMDFFEKRRNERIGINGALLDRKNMTHPV